MLYVLRALYSYGHFTIWTFSVSSILYGQFITMDNLPYGFFTHRSNKANLSVRKALKFIHFLYFLVQCNWKYNINVTCTRNLIWTVFDTVSPHWTITWFEFEFFCFDLPLYLTSFFFLFSCYNIKKVRPDIIDKLMVSKFQKQIILFSILPKNERNTSILGY